ncbi:hypothetical protein V1517DRAFT_320076 [Lipomyces orientalis]|uniref:Uncharacterized protein n=1 Tax=Lipomyces orientalis TaxID=1233043 RepID=A0ACC3TQT2_9ASCO
MHASAQRKHRPANLALSSATSLRDGPLLASPPATGARPPSPSPSPSPLSATGPVVQAPPLVTRGARPVSRSVSSGIGLLQVQQQQQQQQHPHQHQQQYALQSQLYQHQQQDHLALLYSHHQSQLITPPEEYHPGSSAEMLQMSQSQGSGSASSKADDLDIIGNIINDSDQEASVEAAASLLRRQPSVRNANAEIFLDPDAFSDLAGRQPDAGLAQSGSTAGVTSASNSSGSSPAANFGKAIFKKMVPSKLRQGLKRRMSAPIAPTAPIASLSSPSFAASQQVPYSLSMAATAAASPLTPQQQSGDGYFDLDIASNTNLETGEFVATGSATKNSSRHSLLFPSTGPAAASPAPTSSPQLPGTASILSETTTRDTSYPVVVSPTPVRSGVVTPTTGASTPLTSSAGATVGSSSMPHSPLPISTGQQTVSSSVLAASAAMSAVISSSPPIPPSPLATRPPPELSEIPTPLSPTPISPQSSSAVPSPRPRSVLAFEGSVPMVTSASASAGASRTYVSSPIAGLSMTSFSSASAASLPSTPIPIQQLQQRLYHQLTLQESHDAVAADELSDKAGENTTAHAPTASMSSGTSSSTSGAQLHAAVESEPDLLDEEAILRSQIATLYDKMRAEDQAFEATEIRLGESGWTSDEDLAAIRKNRLAARRKWEQAIAQAEASLRTE